MLEFLKKTSTMIIGVFFALYKFSISGAFGLHLDLLDGTFVITSSSFLFTGTRKAAQPTKVVFPAHSTMHFSVIPNTLSKVLAIDTVVMELPAVKRRVSFTHTRDVRATFVAFFIVVGFGV